MADPELVHLKSDVDVNLDASRASLVAAEELLKVFSVHHPLHSIILRLPDPRLIIGHPHASRHALVPHIVQSALGHLPIVVPAESVDDTFIAIDDISTALVQAATMLDLASQKAYVQRMAFVAEIDLVGPVATGRGGVPGLAQVAVSITRSDSPLALLGGKGSSATLEPERSPNVLRRKTAVSALGLTPQISVHAAISTYLASILRLQTNHLSKRIAVACSSPPSIPVLEEGLLALNTCEVQLVTLIEGSYHTLACSGENKEPHLAPLALSNAVPFKEGVGSVELIVERHDGRLDVQIRCPVLDSNGQPTAKSYAIAWARGQEEDEFVDATHAGVDVISEWYTLEVVQRDSRSFTLRLPLDAQAEGDQPVSRLMFQEMGQGDQLKQVRFVPGGTLPILWKINPIGCPKSAPAVGVWDYFKEDRE